MIVSFEAGSTAAGAERQISGVKCGPSSEKHGLLVGLNGVFGVKPFINFDLIVPVHISNFSVSGIFYSPPFIVFFYSMRGTF
ncbi:hypothetical protein V6N11_007702 [Hibiscus sabdariffa]|uniref:Uncharacterized protein n=1 Tax=Hibiscus sabdariffa TaxID=183260 RepID=A0ABR2NJ58_9ROSI